VSDGDCFYVVILTHDPSKRSLLSGWSCCPALKVWVFLFDENGKCVFNSMGLTDSRADTTANVRSLGSSDHWFVILSSSGTGALPRKEFFLVSQKQEMPRVLALDVRHNTVGFTSEPEHLRFSDGMPRVSFRCDQGGWEINLTDREGAVIEPYIHWHEDSKSFSGPLAGFVGDRLIFSVDQEASLEYSVVDDAAQ